MSPEWLKLRLFGRFGTQRVELRRSGTFIKLREQFFLVLVYLLEHAGAMVTPEELRQPLWPSDTFADFDHSPSTALGGFR
jgi:DNA-binding winged helix-turn-helix (wHTH) protein